MKRNHLFLQPPPLTINNLQDFLNGANLKLLLSDRTLNLLNSDDKNYLKSLLPPFEQLDENDTDALNNVFINAACQRWLKRSKEGEMNGFLKKLLLKIIQQKKCQPSKKILLKKYDINNNNIILNTKHQHGETTTEPQRQHNKMHNIYQKHYLTTKRSRLPNNCQQNCHLVETAMPTNTTMISSTTTTTSSLLPMKRLLRSFRLDHSYSCPNSSHRHENILNGDLLHDLPILNGVNGDGDSDSLAIKRNTTCSDMFIMNKHNGYCSQHLPQQQPQQFFQQISSNTNPDVHMDQHQFFGNASVDNDCSVPHESNNQHHFTKLKSIFAETMSADELQNDTYQLQQQNEGNKQHPINKFDHQQYIIDNNKINGKKLVVVLKNIHDEQRQQQQHCCHHENKFINIVIHKNPSKLSLLHNGYRDHHHQQELKFLHSLMPLVESIVDNNTPTPFLLLTSTQSSSSPRSTSTLSTLSSIESTASSLPSSSFYTLSSSSLLWPTPVLSSSSSSLSQSSS